MKKFIIGFIAGAIVFGTVGVYAVGGKMIEVFYSIKDIKINKMSQMPEQKPFTYNGTTFVPLRFISEKLGQPVKWDGDTETIYIGKFEGEKIYPGSGINYKNLEKYNLEFITSYENGGTVQDVLGNSFDTYLLFKYQPTISEKPEGELTFPLNRKYSKFKATVALTKSGKEIDKPIILNIYADEKRVYAGVVDRGKLPTDIELDISEAINLKISTSLDSEKGGELALINAHFIKN